MRLALDRAGLILTLALSLVGGAARAETAPGSVTGTVAGTASESDAARKLYNQGEAAFLGGNYSEAIALFERAYAEQKLPALLWNIAQSHRRQYDIDQDAAHLRRARDVYENYAGLTHDTKAREEATREASAIVEKLRELDAQKQARALEPPGKGEPPLLLPVEPATSTTPSTRALTSPQPGGAIADSDGRPVYTRWWLWAGVGAVVLIAGVATAVALGSRDLAAPTGAGQIYSVKF